MLFEFQGKRYFRQALGGRQYWRGSARFHTLAEMAVSRWIGDVDQRWRLSGLLDVSGWMQTVGLNADQWCGIQRACDNNKKQT